jgi:hypothetical protein
MLRVTGKVTKRDSREGAKLNPETGELRPWKINSARVLVAGQALVDVSAFEREGAPALPALHDECDLAVEAESYKGKINYNLVGTWASLFAAPAKSLHAAAS